VSPAVTTGSKNWRGANLVKDATKNFFSDGSKKHVKIWILRFEIEWGLI
jgi:hypothetical protein